jgi:hypothetical protein
MQFYIPIPKRLIIESQDNPAVIGLYALIARQHFITRQPIPLSRTDIQNYDPTLRHGAIKRALDRLVEGGWLIEDAQYKTHYLPTWGQTRYGQPYRWMHGQPYLGCPRHVQTQRLPVELLDHYLGRLTPLAQLPALVERYIKQPLLSLRDIGIYALQYMGFQQTSPALEQQQLTMFGRPLQVPDLFAFLAKIYQNTPDLLTENALRKLGIEHEEPAQTEETLIAPQIPDQIAAQIGILTEFKPENQALTSVETPELPSASKIQRIQKESSKETNQPSGGQNIKSKKFSQLAQTNSARRLRQIGVLPQTSNELANTPIHLVEQAIDHAHKHPQVRDHAAWVVHLLRTNRDYGWQINQPPLNPQAYASDYCRLGSDTSDLESPTTPDNVIAELQDQLRIIVERPDRDALRTANFALTNNQLEIIASQKTMDQLRKYNGAIRSTLQNHGINPTVQYRLKA